jgi:hypothetical protein
MRLRNNLGLDQHLLTQRKNADISSSTSRHSSSPLTYSPDIARELGKADSIIQKTREFLGTNDDDDDDTIEHPVPSNLSPMRGSSVEIGQKDDTKSLAIHHPSSRKTLVLHQESPKEIAKEKAESELWKTEQAMKRELDAETAHKSGNLWKNTVNFVHKTDPNADLISKLTHRELPGEQASKIKRAAALKRVGSKPDAMKEKLKAELDSRTKNDMGRIEDQSINIQKQGLDQVAHESKVAETATAHKNMALGDMKRMLTSQLDDSVKNVVKRAKQLQGFSSDSQLEKRLKAELDAKAKAQEQKLLHSKDAQRSLILARRKLHGRVTRAAKVREQLSKEMREENAIRKQLDMRAERAGKRMLKYEMSGKGALVKDHSHRNSRADLEAALRNRLEMKDQQMLKSGSSAAAERQKEAKDRSKGGLVDRAHQLQDYLRKQLDAHDATTQERLYRRAEQGHLLKRIRSVRGQGPLKAAARARQLHAAALRLFQSSMRRAEQKGGGKARTPRDFGEERRAVEGSLKGRGVKGRPTDRATAELMKETLQRADRHRPFAGLHEDEAVERKQAASAPPPLDVHTTTVRLMKEALQRSGGHEPFASLHREEARENKEAAVRQSQAVDVHTEVERMMASALRRARGVKPFAKFHAARAGAAALAATVHDMAHANQESTMRAGGLIRSGKLDAVVLGHYKELQDADATAEAIRQARSKTVHEAQEEEQQAVE